MSPELMRLSRDLARCPASVLAEGAYISLRPETAEEIASLWPEMRAFLVDEEDAVVLDLREIDATRLVGMIARAGMN